MNDIIEKFEDLIDDVHDYSSNKMDLRTLLRTSALYIMLESSLENSLENSIENSIEVMLKQ